jgi:hypothetical protein
LKVRLINNLYGVVFAIVRLAAIAADVASRRLATANRGRASSAIGQMNDRQLQEVGLSPTRGSTLNDGYASAEAQLGMVR